MVYVTGDTHGYPDHFFYTYGKNKGQLLPQYAALTREDVVIVAGDFGYIHDAPKRVALLDQLAALPFELCFVDGNHENFDLLYTFPVEQWCGGRVHRIRDNIRHLMRGEIFRIQGRTIFTFGGAGSIDRSGRIEGLSWWPQEIPTQEEYDTANRHLELQGADVDYIICHTCPNFLYPYMGVQMDSNAGDEFLIEFLAEVAMHSPAKNFSQFLYGHWHMDKAFWGGRYRALLDDLVELPLVEKDDASGYH